jgi:DNA polymerase III subunit gamma/tau
MPYQVTARKWRPRRFSEVVAQEHITTTLANAVTAGRVAQCYLLCGPRGVGKTTTARILAKALNCPDRTGADPCDACSSCRSIADGTSMNTLEIDGASNNSVDDVRELREVVRYLPTEGSHKIYIIDEVHMLSTAAFNALLKTLEEPPDHVVFIFATTEVQDVPDTILSRCQRFNFRRIPAGDIAAHLRTIAESEAIAADEEALYLLAARADGALRDAQSLLDQVVSFDSGRISLDVVHQVLGLVDRSVNFAITQALEAGAADRVLDLLAEVVDSGIDVEEFIHGLVEHVRHLMFTRVQGSAQQLDVAEGEQAEYEQAAAAFAAEDLVRILHDLMELQAALRRSVQPRFRVELALVRLALMGKSAAIGELLQRVRSLEAGLQDGGLGEPATAADPAPTAGSATGGAAPPPSGAGVQGTEAPAAAIAPVAAGDAKAAAPVRREPARSGAMASAAAAADDDAGPGPETGADLSLGAVQQDWEKLVGDIRGEQPALAMFLRGVQLVSLDGHVLTLAFPGGDRFQISQVQRSHDAIEKLCHKRWGKRLRLDCVVAADGPEVADSRPAPETDPAVRSVLDTFDGELV